MLRGVFFKSNINYTSRYDFFTDLSLLLAGQQQHASLDFLEYSAVYCRQSHLHKNLLHCSSKIKTIKCYY